MTTDEALARAVRERLAEPGVLTVPPGQMPPGGSADSGAGDELLALLDEIAEASEAPPPPIVVEQLPGSGTLPEGEFQIVVTPPLRAVLEKLLVAGLVLLPIPVVGPDGQPTLDPEHWPGNDLPTYALKPA